MDKFSITGPCRVMKGEVSISGSKNAALPILAATLLFDKPVIIENLPRVRDIDTMLNLLKSLGSNIQFLNNKKTVKITKTKKQKQFASYSIVKTMRAGILVLGPLVAKYHKSISSFPGGCVLNGNSGRPINLHLEALKKLGMPSFFNASKCKLIGLPELPFKTHPPGKLEIDLWYLATNGPSTSIPALIVLTIE